MIKPGDLCIVTKALYPGKERYLGHIYTVIRKGVDTTNFKGVTGWFTEPLVRSTLLGGIVIFTDGELTPIPPLKEDIHELDTLDVPA
jgi:hypothetical protein